MVRTQIQLPDRMFRSLQALAEDQEWSMTEAVRRGVALLLERYPAHRDDDQTWTFPEAVDLGGDFLADVSEWRELSNERTS